MTADELVSRHTAAWQAATIHPFLAGVRDGSVSEDSFDRWLAQDYLYAQALFAPSPASRPRPPSPTSASSRGAWLPPFGQNLVRIRATRASGRQPHRQRGSGDQAHPRTLQRCLAIKGVRCQDVIEMRVRQRWPRR
jgi:hypothetical protein